MCYSLTDHCHASTLCSSVWAGTCLYVDLGRTKGLLNGAALKTLYRLPNVGCHGASCGYSSQSRTKEKEVSTLSFCKSMRVMNWVSFSAAKTLARRLAQSLVL